MTKAEIKLLKEFLQNKTDRWNSSTGYHSRGYQRRKKGDIVRRR